jgi:hypothetical protein
MHAWEPSDYPPRPRHLERNTLCDGRGVVEEARASFALETGVEAGFRRNAGEAGVAGERCGERMVQLERSGHGADFRRIKFPVRRNMECPVFGGNITSCDLLPSSGIGSGACSTSVDGS